MTELLSVKSGLPESPAMEILGNVGRLAKDARLLFREERYASSVALSILAIEELAKFVSVTGVIGKSSLPLEAWRFHHKKQVQAATFVLQKRFWAAYIKCIKEMGISSDDEIAIRDGIVPFLRDPDNKGMEDLPREIFFKAYQATLDDKSLHRFMRAFSKDYDRDKQTSFYVDINPDGELVSTPARITKDMAEEYDEIVREICRCLLLEPVE